MQTFKHIKSSSPRIKIVIGFRKRKFQGILCFLGSRKKAKSAHNCSDVRQECYCLRFEADAAFILTRRVHFTTILVASILIIYELNQEDDVKLDFRFPI